MKSLQILFLLTAVTINLSAFSQKNSEVKENVVAMSLGERTGFSVSLGNVNEKDAIKALKTWITDMQKKADTDETGKHEIMSGDVLISALSETPVNIYFLFAEEKDEIIATGFFEINGAFVSSTTNPAKVQNCIQLMEKFKGRIQKIGVEEKLTIAKKELSKRNDEQVQLEKKNKQLNDQITEWNKLIEKAKSDLDQNAKDQEGKKSEISNQEKNVEEIQKEYKLYEIY